ncbi:MAG: DUF996 domain-containing protein [Sulfolobales archaeon]
MQSVSTKLSQAKILGGIGSILMLLYFAPYVGFVIFLVGLALVLVALKYISDETREPRIFNYALYSLIAVVIGVVVLMIFVLAYFMAFMIGGFISVEKSVHIPGATYITSIGPPTISRFFEILLAVIVPLVIAWIVLIVAAILIKKSYDLAARALGVNWFSVAATLYLVGVALMIVLVGFVILLIALVIQIIAFFSIPEKLPETPQQQLV